MILSDVRIVKLCFLVALAPDVDFSHRRFLIRNSSLGLCSCGDWDFMILLTLITLHEDSKLNQ